MRGPLDGEMSLVFRGQRKEVWETGLLTIHLHWLRCRYVTETQKNSGLNKEEVYYCLSEKPEPVWWLLCRALGTQWLWDPGSHTPSLGSLPGPFLWGL